MKKGKFRIMVKCGEADQCKNMKCSHRWYHLPERTKEGCVCDSKSFCHFSNKDQVYIPRPIQISKKRNKFFPVLIILALVIGLMVLLMLSGCENQRAFQAEMANEKTSHEKAVDACIAAGGVPLFYNVGGGLKTCQFTYGKGGG